MGANGERKETVVFFGLVATRTVVHGWNQGSEISSYGECETIVQIYVGEKENHSMKKSAKIIHEKLQGSFIQVLPNMYHGEFSINHADDYVRKLLEIVKQR